MTRTISIALILTSAACGASDNEEVIIGTTSELSLEDGTGVASCNLADAPNGWHPFPNSTSCYCLSTMTSPGDEGVLAVWVDAREPRQLFRVDSRVAWNPATDDAASARERTSRPFPMARSAEDDRLWTMDLTRSGQPNAPISTRFRVRGFRDLLRELSSEDGSTERALALQNTDADTDIADTDTDTADTDTDTDTADTDSEDGGATTPAASPCAAMR